MDQGCLLEDLDSGNLSISFLMAANFQSFRIPQKVFSSIHRLCEDVSKEPGLMAPDDVCSAFLPLRKVDVVTVRLAFQGPKQGLKHDSILSPVLTTVVFRLWP